MSDGPQPSGKTAMTKDGTGQRISLVLGSGGARGLAHIGVIRHLEERGFRIASISGCSMGALVGGIYAAGKLEAYRDWACALTRTDVLRFLDLSFLHSGLIKGDRIMETLKEMVGEHAIQDLAINFTAVATDIERQREVWLTDGPLFDAIRASIAVPTVFTPHTYRGLVLVDGGLLNPVPIAPTFRDLTDLTVAVSLNADPLVATDANRPASTKAGPAPDPPAAKERDLNARILAFLDDVGASFKADEEAQELGMFELLNRSFDTMQNAISAMKLAAYAPDVLIEVPRDVCEAYEFYRAQELIETGYRLTEQAFSKRSF
jgi:NTE family protein